MLLQSHPQIYANAMYFNNKHGDSLFLCFILFHIIRWFCMQEIRKIKSQTQLHSHLLKFHNCFTDKTAVIYYEWNCVYMYLSNMTYGLISNILGLNINLCRDKNSENQHSAAHHLSNFIYFWFLYEVLLLIITNAN